MFCIAVFTLGVFGARGPVLKMVILLIFLSHYYYKPIKLSLKTLTKFSLLGLISILFIGVVAYVRKFQIVGPSEDIGFLDSVVETFSHMSHIGTYMFIFKHFDMSNIWMGYSYLNLFSFLGVVDVGGKVPLDDGRYVLGLMKYGNVSPVETVENLPGSSYPPGVWFGFMQFYYVGLFVFALLAGLIKGFFYRLFINSGRKLFLFFVMYYVAYSFMFTNFHIFRCALYGVFFVLFFIIYNVLKKLSLKSAIKLYTTKL